MNHRANYPANMQALLDVSLQLSAELASSVKTARELLCLKVGSVVEFEQAAKAPVDLYVSETLVAQGEIVVVDGSFCIRVTSLISHSGGCGTQSSN